jgi:hypothetical protein
MSEYIPTTEDVLYDFAKPWEAGVDDFDVRVAAFERWLAGVKHEAMQKGYDAGCEQGYEVGYDRGVHDFFAARQSND